jgi:hypothetical protein
MSIITIQCRLFANEETCHLLWELMAERNTPLVNELLRLVALHPDFTNWRSKGKLPTSEVTKLAQTLKTDSRFNNQPAKFYISSEKTAIYIFQSWLAIQKRTQQKLEGKQSWLRMLRTNEELVSDGGQDLEKIKQQAQSLLLRYKTSDNAPESNQLLRKHLYQIYDNTDNLLTRSAIAYLLKNRCQIPTDGDGGSQKFLKYRRKIENQVKRLSQQLENRLPQGRDLTGDRFLEVLDVVTHQVPIDNQEAAKWQSQLLKRPDLVPPQPIDR